MSEPIRSAAPPPADDDTVIMGRSAVPVWREDPPDEPPEQPPPEFSRPPRIDPEELAGLSQADTPTARSRVMPLTDEASRLIARYLFPTERFRGEWRRHPIHLGTPISVAVGATVVLGLGGGFAQALLGSGWVALVAVLLWLLAMVWAGLQIAQWHYDRFILTNKRIMKISGIVTRDVAMMPLGRVTDMKYEQSPMGRVFNYGTFVIESAGQDQALREVPHLPNPNELYLRVVEEMYDPGAVEDRVDKALDEEEDDRKGGGG